jgi:hypothetical protein
MDATLRLHPRPVKRRIPLEYLVAWTPAAQSRILHRRRCRSEGEAFLSCLRATARSTGAAQVFARRRRADAWKALPGPRYRSESFGPLGSPDDRQGIIQTIEGERKLPPARRGRMVPVA